MEGLSILWASVSSAAGLAPTLDADFPCDQNDALLSSAGAGGGGNESKERPRQEERGALNSKLCSRAHKGKCCEVHDAATLARDPRPRPPRLHPPVANEHINAVQQAMKWFNFDEYRGGKLDPGIKAEVPPVDKKDPIAEFKDLQMKCISPEMEGMKQARSLDAMRRMHKMQFDGFAAAAGKLKKVMTKSNDKGVKDVVTLHAFVPCQQHHPPGCDCLVCRKRLADAAEDSNDLKRLALDLEEAVSDISELRREVSTVLPGKKVHDASRKKDVIVGHKCKRCLSGKTCDCSWSKLRETVKLHKRLKQKNFLNEGVAVFSLGP